MSPLHSHSYFQERIKMGILDNLEAYIEHHENLATKVFSETVCENCSCKTESAPMSITDNMGREIFWEDMGRP
jgi:hypothetical protein